MDPSGKNDAHKRMSSVKKNEDVNLGHSFPSDYKDSMKSSVCQSTVRSKYKENTIYKESKF